MTAIATESQLNGAKVQLPLDSPLSDQWSKAAPARVRKLYPALGSERGWQAWVAYLAKRRRPQPLAELLPGREPPLAWALPAALHDSDRGHLVERLARLERHPAQHPAGDIPLADELADWLAFGKLEAADPAYALHALAWCRALPGLAGLVPEELWWRLWQRLHWLADEALDRPAYASCAPEVLLAQQWLAVELPLTLGYQLPELSPSAAVGTAARKHLAHELEQLLPEAGLLPARLWPVWRPLLACWTRGLAMSGKPTARGKRKAAKVPGPFVDFVVNSWRLFRADGSQMLPGDAAASAWNGNLFAASNRLLADADQDVAAISRLAAPESKKRGRSAARFRAPDPAAHAEAAACAVMRSGWEPADVRLACTYDDHLVQLELGVGRDTLLAGPWTLEVRVAGRTIQQESPWDQVCWYSDQEVDYLEIEARYEAGLRVQRQILLARQDRFLLLADAVLGGPGPQLVSAAPGENSHHRPTGSDVAELTYTGLLPLAADLAWDVPPETSEVLLRAGKGGDKPTGKRRALVLPLALHEWRSAAVAGSLGRAAAGMQLRQTARGRSLFAPLFFDLDRRRLTKELTWRQLTVGESLKVLPNDAAAGYRVEVGREQWLLYRSLIPGGVRSVLGQQTTREFFAARFKRGTGEAEHLLEIEME